MTIPYSQDELFPDAATPLVADQSSAERRRRIILHTAVRVGDLAGIEDEDITEDPAATALAVLAANDHGWEAYLPRDRGEPIDIVNRYIVANNPGTVGTAVFGGDYDMALIILVRIAIEYQRYLSPEARISLRDKLLTQVGAYDGGQLTWGLNFQETENHILMIEVSRYLTNSLFGFDNTGMVKFLTDQMLDHLGNDFQEYNSRPYQRLAVQAITLLADHSADPVDLGRPVVHGPLGGRGVSPPPSRGPAVDLDDAAKLGFVARLVLDYLTAKFAVSSNGLRRHVPFRRRNDRTGVDGFFDNEADREQRRFLALTGHRRFYNEADPGLESLDFDGGTIVQSVLSSYRPPLAMINLMLVNEGKEYFQRFHHYGLEIFSSTPAFLISAGGIWLDGPYGHGPGGQFGWEDDSIPMPIVLMPSDTGIRVSDVVHIDGTPLSGTTAETVSKLAGAAGGFAAGAETCGPWCAIGGAVLGFFGGKKVGHDIDTATDTNRINTGVAPGFACGLSVQLPNYLTKAGDRRVHDGLTLIDCTTLPSPEQHYLAVRQDPVSGDLPAGWIVAVPATALTFTQFERNVLAGGGLDAVTRHGLHNLDPAPAPDVSFTPGGDTGDRFRWPIRGANGEWIDATSWPLAAGDVINSEDHNGVIHIDPPIFEVLKRTNRKPRSMRTELKRYGITLPAALRTALQGIAHVPSGAAISTKTVVFGVAAIQAMHISARVSLRSEAGKRGISLSGGLRGALRNVPGISLEVARSVRTSLALLRRRLTLDGPGRRLIGPNYTAREVAVLHVADLGWGVRQLFGHQRGLAEIRLTDFVERPRLPGDPDQRRRYTVREACRRINADPARGLLRLFPAQVSQRTSGYRMSTILRPT